MTDRADATILIVEDDAAMARLLRHLLELDGHRRIRHVWTGEQAIAAADGTEIVLLDQQLPDMRGLDALPRLLNRPNPPSVVMITAHGSESLAATALRQGAEDYLTKDHTLPELLPRVCERVRRSRALRAALAEAEAELVRSERLAAIGEVSVTLHHELNNPLMAALAEVDLALGDGSLADQLRPGLETIRAALLRIRDTIRRVALVRQAGTVDYLEGSRMIELADAGPGERPYRGRAVVSVPDQRLARMFGPLLRSAGFEVERTLSLEDIALVASSVGVSLVLMDAPGAAAARLGPRADRRYVLAVLGEAPVEADLVIPIPFDPAALVEDLVKAVVARDRADGM